MWVARDNNGDLWLFIIKPRRENKGGGYWFVEDLIYNGIQIDSSLFPDLKWEDEPIEVDLFNKETQVVMSKKVWQRTISGKIKCK